MSSHGEQTAAKRQEWPMCLEHGFTIPPGTDDCGGGEAGTCIAEPDARMIESIQAEFDHGD